MPAVGCRAQPGSVLGSPHPGPVGSPQTRAARSGPKSSGCSREQQGNQCHLLGAATSEVAGAAVGRWAPPAVHSARCAAGCVQCRARRRAAAAGKVLAGGTGCSSLLRAPQAPRGLPASARRLRPFRRTPAPREPRVAVRPRWPASVAHVQAPASARSCSTARSSPASSRGHPCPFAVHSLGKHKPVAARSVPPVEAEPCLKAGAWQAVVVHPAPHHHSRSPRTPLHCAVLVPMPCHARRAAWWG